MVFGLFKKLLGISTVMVSRKFLKYSVAYGSAVTLANFGTGTVWYRKVWFEKDENDPHQSHQDNSGLIAAYSIARGALATLAGPLHAGWLGYRYYKAHQEKDILWLSVAFIPGWTFDETLRQNYSIFKPKERLKDKASDMAEQARSKLHDAKDQVKDKASGLTDKASGLTDKASGLTDKATSKINDTKDQVKDKVSSVTDKSKGTSEDLKDQVKDKSSDFKSKAEGVIDQSKGKVEDAKNQMKNTTTGLLATASGMKDSIVNKYHDVTGTTDVKEVAKDAQQKAKEGASSVTDKVKEAASSVKDKVNQAAGAIKGQIQDSTKNSDNKDSTKSSDNQDKNSDRQQSKDSNNVRFSIKSNVKATEDAHAQSVPKKATTETNAADICKQPADSKISPTGELDKSRLKDKQPEDYRGKVKNTENFDGMDELHNTTTGGQPALVLAQHAKNLRGNIKVSETDPLKHAEQFKSSIGSAADNSKTVQEKVRAAADKVSNSNTGSADDAMSNLKVRDPSIIDGNNDKHVQEHSSMGKMKDNAYSLQETASGLIATATVMKDSIVNKVNEVTGQNTPAKDAKNNVQANAHDAKDTTKNVASNISDKAVAAKEAVQAKLNSSSVQDVKDSAKSVASNITDKAVAAKDAVQAKLNSTSVQDVKDSAKSVASNITDKAVAAKDAVQAKLNSTSVQDVKDSAKNVASNIADKAVAVKDSLMNTKDNTKTNSKEIKDDSKEVKKNVSENAKDVKKNVQANAHDAKEKTKDNVQDVKQNVKANAQDVKEKIQESKK